jgi:ABC-2 type transport system ATP-binding protein
MENILEIKNLRKEYPEFVLDRVSLSLPRGTIMGLIGPNGAGKTTTIKLILNHIRADGGEVTIFGLDHRRDEKEIKNRIGYVGEEQYFYDYRSASWTGKFVSHFFERWEQGTFERLLEEFRIPTKTAIKKLSKGERVKLALAVALSHDPELIILDEPTAGLDPVIRRDVIDFLQDFAASGEKSVLISSHITDDVSRIAETIAYMINGRIALVAPKDELLSNWKKIHFKKGSLNGRVLASLHHVEDHMFGRSGLIRNYPEVKDALEPFAEGGDVRVEPIGLDDILIALVKEY